MTTLKNKKVITPVFDVKNANSFSLVNEKSTTFGVLFVENAD